MTQKRKAYTLIEVITSMSLGMSLMGLAIGLVHQSMTIKSISDQRARHDRNSQRLLDEFRKDVHAAVSCVMIEDGIEISLPAGKRIEYVSQDDRITRMEPLTEDRIRREAYELSEPFFAQFSIAGDPSQAILTIKCRCGNDGERVDRQAIVRVGR
ncbi:hypothetical protein Q31b_39970 [Novipirellula aureliae]|uniref:Prepilin-type N-terminal cleavage/methylation domain-containing protein n=1 Tax=Novipirellula aureliae TaxID=2527966 RepID=A0A5C6DVS7_9BACT|nr:hypothetical protein [Novipirellula aureliae]TWU38919.1 hypothetical protein Q31b_39970 [Novipirellula aureliae]